jgi:hypothetical protein
VFSTSKAAMRVAGIDLGLVRNATAFVALAGSAERFDLIDEHMWKPARASLRLKEILPAIEMRANSLRVRVIGHDQHYAQSVVEHFDEATRRIELVRTPAQITPLYVDFRKDLELNIIGLAKSSKRLREELDCVAYHFGASGGIIVELPTLPDGTHCDLVSALLAAYAAITRGVTGHILGSGNRNLASLTTQRYKDHTDGQTSETWEDENEDEDGEEAD